MAAKPKVVNKGKAPTLGLSSAKGERSSGKIKGDKPVVRIKRFKKLFICDY